ncbi:MAG: BrnT family toxin [Bryobacteraceae bacterium]|jgi:uncharacterized DUF497 family protein
MLFEWDDEKAAANLRNHGIDFQEAISLSVMHSLSNGSMAVRTRVKSVSVLLGMCNGTILHVTFTERGERIRLISARPAEKHERDDYYRENST